jgi:hypothetical protein
MANKTQLENKVTIALAVLIVGAVGAFFYLKRPAPIPPLEETHASPSPVISESPAPSPSPTIRYPVPPEKEAVGSSLSKQKPLPQLDESDASIQTILADLFGKSQFDKLVNVTDLIRRFVVTVDSSLEIHAAGSDFAAFIPAAGELQVVRKKESITLSAKNGNRYKAYVALIDGVNSKKLVAGYVHLYPLIQAAYRDVSKNGYFNDRLIDAIDSLLETPDVAEPIQLTEGGVYFKYADPKLEACPSGQKVLMRIGRDNAKILKAKLKELRGLIAHLDVSG